MKPVLTYSQLAWRSAAYHWRVHAGVLLGAAVGTAALVGALLVGDSVRGSLRERALSRVGRAEVVLSSRDRFFTDRTATNLLWKDKTWQSGSLQGTFAQNPASALILPAFASVPNGAARANHVSLIGIRSGTGASFWDYALFPQTHAVAAGSVWLNAALARQLGIRKGDTVIFRAAKPSALSAESPISPRSDQAFALRLEVAGLVPASGLGDFATTAGQGPPMNAFVNLAELQAASSLAGRCNLLLAGPAANSGSTGTVELATAAFQQSWRLEDTEQSLTLRSNAVAELRSRRVFLDDAVAQAALKTASNAVPLLTYLANLITGPEGAAPYSMVTAAGPSYTPADLAPNEIVVNEWLASDLKLRPGDPVTLTYFDPESGALLREKTNTFIVRSIVPLQPPWADPGLMPDFPGIEKAESARDWDTGFPLVHPIRPQDDTYWREHRGTPKAFVSLQAGRRMWSNRFGSLTALRIPLTLPANAAPGADPLPVLNDLKSRVMARLEPGRLGLQFEPARGQALRGAAEGQDFGQLFLGFSFLLVISSLLLTALLFQFGLEQRTREVGILLAVGWTPAQARKLLLVEAALLAVLGAGLGALGGIAYARGLLWGLRTIWSEAVAGTILQFHMTAPSVLIGAASGFAIAWLTVWLGMRKLVRRPARELLLREPGAPVAAKDLVARPGRRSRLWWILPPVLALLAALLLAAASVARRDNANAEVFFSGGSLALLAGFLACRTWLCLAGAPGQGTVRSFTQLALRNCSRRRGRSLTVIMLLAAAVFIIGALAVFRLDSGREIRRDSGGAGGFAWIGESTLPILNDLNSAAGREAAGLSDQAMRNVHIVQARVRDGDEASCLNLNRAQVPRILGVNPREFQGRFTFIDAAPGLDRSAGWALLVGTPSPASPISSPDNPIPAIGDANSIRWALGKKLGDTIEINLGSAPGNPSTNGAPRVLKLRLVGAVANSILQGSLIIDEAAFVRAFPGETGWRMFFVNAPRGGHDVAGELTRGLGDAGLELTPALERLANFNAVQNTYLGTFQVLGGLGLLLGSAGLGIVVLRNVLERRGELAVLVALGCRRRDLHRLVLTEHALLLLLGLAVGVVAAALAVVPGVLALRTEVPWLLLGITLGAVLLNGLLCAWFATRIALRGELLESLRRE